MCPSQTFAFHSSPHPSRQLKVPPIPQTAQAPNLDAAQLMGKLHASLGRPPQCEPATNIKFLLFLIYTPGRTQASRKWAPPSLQGRSGNVFQGRMEPT